jgi:hypothetical protein
LTHAGEGFLAVARVIDLQPRIAQPFGHGRRQGALILDQQNARSPHRFH